MLYYVYKTNQIKSKWRLVGLMAKISVAVLNEKGNMMALPKQAVKSRELNNLKGAFEQNEYDVAKNGSFVKVYHDANGVEFYAIVEFKTSLTHPDDVKRSKPKAKASDIPEISFE